MSKGIIYYTHNQLKEPIFSICQKHIQIGLPILSVSLKPIDFGENLVVPMEPSYFTMLNQIWLGLYISSCDYVFFCEHDVLYPKSHFDFTPPKDDIFYYNENVWRWDYPKDRLIRYDRLISLSGLCVNRKFALDHYKRRIQKILENGWDKSTSHEPQWARAWGYEPGTKKKERGGFSDDDFKTWKSPVPMIDIRHRRTFSPPKTTLDQFKHLPKNWEETTLDKIEGWDLRREFDL